MRIGDFMKAIKLDKNIDCNYICQLLQNLTNEFQMSGANLPESILILDIKPISQTDDNLIPKLEYKN